MAGISKARLLERLRQENLLNPGGRGFSGPRSHNYTPVWVTEVSLFHPNWSTVVRFWLTANSTSHDQMRFHHVGQAGLKLLISNDPPASLASQGAGITDKKQEKIGFCGVEKGCIQPMEPTQDVKGQEKEKDQLEENNLIHLIIFRLINT
ncbi:hypothetical protein AAY473_030633 [Plecturocebus cupreus]